MKKIKNRTIGKGTCKECKNITWVKEHLQTPTKRHYYFKEWEVCSFCNKVWFKEENKVLINGQDEVDYLDNKFEDKMLFDL